MADTDITQKAKKVSDLLRRLKRPKKPSVEEDVALEEEPKPLGDLSELPEEELVEGGGTRLPERVKLVLERAKEDELKKLRRRELP